MPFDPIYHEESIRREDLASMRGAVLLEFGANWCGICRSFAPHLERLLQDFPDVQHIKIEDGPGKPLGRSFRVKLWPTLVFMRDGKIVHQVARPAAEDARFGLEAIASGES